MPLRADGAGPGSSTDRRTWSSYQQAKASPVGVGLGFVLNGDGIICVDLDHCVDDDAVAPWAQTILDMCPATYVELSASGTGLHIWGHGHVAQGRVIRDGKVAVEVYGCGRYIAMGSRWREAPLVLANLAGMLATV